MLGTSSLGPKPGRTRAPLCPEFTMSDVSLISSHLHAVDDGAPGLSTVPLPPREAQIVHWTLRIGAFACYVGHGAFGIITKAAWVAYFAVVGIPEWMAWRLMPIVGTVDILMGILVLVRP